MVTTEAKSIGCSLRDAGMEVIYSAKGDARCDSCFNLQEDVDVIALSSLNNAHMIFPAVLNLMKEKGL